MLAYLGSLPGTCRSIPVPPVCLFFEWLVSQLLEPHRRRGPGTCLPTSWGTLLHIHWGAVTDAEDLCSGSGSRAERSCLKEAWIRMKKLRVHKFSAGSHWERGGQDRAGPPAWSCSAATGRRKEVDTLLWRQGLGRWVEWKHPDCFPLVLTFPFCLRSYSQRLSHNHAKGSQ